MSAWTRFWELVDLGMRDPDALRRTLAEIPEEELVDFYWRFEESAADLKDEEFTQHMEPPQSEDSIDDVAQWVVSQGRRTYEDVMMEPAKMPSELPPGAKPSPWTGVAFRTYRERFGQPMRFRDDPAPDTGA